MNNDNSGNDHDHMNHAEKPSTGDNRMDQQMNIKTDLDNHKEHLFTADHSNPAEHSGHDLHSGHDEHSSQVPR